MTARAAGSIDWDAARDEVARACVAPASLARVLVGMGLFRLHVAPRVAFGAWPPEYERFRSFASVLDASRTEQGRGYRQGAWSAEWLQRLAEQDRRDRAAVADRNRARRFSRVFILLQAAREAVRAEAVAIARRRSAWFVALMAAIKAGAPMPRYADQVIDVAAPAGSVTIWLDAGELDRTGVAPWRTADGGAVGQDLFALGAFVWGCGYGRAAHRVARLCGQRLRTVGEMEAGIRGLAAA